MTVNIDIIHLSKPGPVFYAALGPFLGRADAHAEIGAPIEHMPGKLWFVALVNGEPVGCGGMYRNTMLCELASGYVLPQWRRRGVYRHLVEARLQLAGNLRVAANCKPHVGDILRKFGFTYTTAANGYVHCQRIPAEWTRTPSTFR